MDIRINSVEYKEYWNVSEITMNVNFTTNDVINSNITIHDEKKLDISEIINYIREELMGNG